MYGELKRIAFSLGAGAFGVGYIDDLRVYFDGLTPAQTEGLSHGISIGVRLSTAVLKGITTGPTPLYLHHYRMANMLLDQITLRLSSVIQMNGYNALPIPASQIIDWQRQTAHLSHKMIAIRAGIGWLGKNNLLVHPEYGSHIRLATILTDMPLAVNHKIDNRGCGRCRECIDACPVSAIKEDYREWDKIACLEKLKTYSKTHNIGQYICGICVKVCKPL